MAEGLTYSYDARGDSVKLLVRYTAHDGRTYTAHENVEKPLSRAGFAEKLVTVYNKLKRDGDGDEQRRHG